MPVPFLDTPRPHAFAHRGGAAHAPENSWAAFEHAVKLGYAYLETDARATSDGRLMAFHDRNLERVTDAEGPINLKSYREIAALRVVAIELASSALPLHQAPLDGDVCLAVGNEDHGCSAALLAVADAVAYIPQPGRVGSLNVAVAAAVAMAEARRRAWADAGR